MIRKHVMTLYRGDGDRRFEGVIKQFPFYARQNTTDYPIASDVIDEDVYSSHEIDTIEPVVFDVGANAGSFSLLALNRWRGASIVAYEPHPLNFGMLMYNLRGHDAVCMMSALYGDTLPQSWLVERPEDEATEFGGWGLSQTREPYIPDFHREIGVKCDLRDADTEFMLHIQPGRDVVVKMDCEGSEYSIIDGLSDDAMRSITYITGEIHGNTLKLDYLPYSWGPFRDKMLSYFDCPEIERRKTVGEELFTFLAKRR